VVVYFIWLFGYLVIWLFSDKNKQTAIPETGEFIK
jgi:hypothetical protein